MLWEKKELDTPQVKEISKRFGLSLLEAAILTRRQVTAPDEICYFLESDFRLLHNPFYFNGMSRAIQRILAAIQQGQTIHVYGDRDVDGITATVLLVESLESLGAKINWSLPEGEDEYGLTPAVIQRVGDEGVGLLITVDCGVTNIAEVEQARAAGIDTIVVDHHNPQEQLPPAVCVIDPKIPDSGYPFRELSGCGVAWKLDWALQFSRTPYYERQLCLLNVRPVNQAYAIEAIRLRNLVPVDRIMENVVPGMLAYKKTRLAAFLEDDEITVLDAELHGRLLERIFGTCPCPLTDLAPMLRETFPELEGKSLLKLKEISRFARYSLKPVGEIDMLRMLYAGLVQKRIEPLVDASFDRLDLVALGTIADLMPLRNENRILVRRGLEVLNTGRRDGLRALLFRKNLAGKQIRSREIAWDISPLINSAGRMGQPGKATRLLLSKTEQELQGLAEEIIGLNRKRKSLGSAEWEWVLQQAREVQQRTDEKFILVADERIQRGITGILATRLANIFQTPAIVIAILKERAVGSLRSPSEVMIGEFLGQFSDLLTNFGGHDFAAGFTLPVESLSRFKQRFHEVVAGLDKWPRAESKICVDAELPPRLLTPELRRIMEAFEPYGEGNPPLVFLTCGLIVRECEVVANAHMKYLLDAGRYKWPAMYWRSAEKVGSSFSVGDSIDTVYRLSHNSYMNMDSLQLTILDMKK